MKTLTKPCLNNCGKIIYKQINRSLKDWNNRTKYCSRKCGYEHFPYTKSWREKQSKSHLGHRPSKETLLKKSLAQQGKKGSNWKGDDVGYCGIHTWLRKNFGKANRCENPKCHYPRMGAKKWLEKPYGYEWALKKGKEYKRKRNHFIQLCTSCHRKQDSNKNKSRSK